VVGNDAGDDATRTPHRSRNDLKARTAGAHRARPRRPGCAGAALGRPPSPASGRWFPRGRRSGPGQPRRLAQIASPLAPARPAGPTSPGRSSASDPASVIQAEEPVCSFPRRARVAGRRRCRAGSVARPWARRRPLGRQSAVRPPGPESTIEQPLGDQRDRVARSDDSTSDRRDRSGSHGGLAVASFPWVATSEELLCDGPSTRCMPPSPEVPGEALHSLPVEDGPAGYRAAPLIVSISP
jgi:hypothetical protein